ncbi:MAG: hypothetical protein H0T79_15160, partial [Deltaproteobacteria bacterium]|nr:hypothetical protein [Deltaproteobacteria bacterium]
MVKAPIRAALSCGALGLVALASGCSPFGGGAFACDSDRECAGGPVAGRCEPGFGVCSFEDSACPLGWRFGDASGGLANTCVGGASVDAGDGPDTPSGVACYGTGSLQVCPLTTPTEPLTIDTAIPIDTGTDARCIALEGDAPYCVLAG